MKGYSKKTTKVMAYLTKKEIGYTCKFWQDLTNTE